MPITENTAKVISYLASIAETLSQYGNENKGLSQYITAKGELDNLSALIRESTDLNAEQKDGMNKLISFLGSEIDKRIKMYNETENN